MPVESAVAAIQIDPMPYASPAPRRIRRFAQLAVLSFALFTGPALAQTDGVNRNTTSDAMAGGSATLSPEILERAIERARALPGLRTLIVAHHGSAVVEQAFQGRGLDEPVNVKSISKAIIAALVGAALDRGVLDGVDQPIAPLLKGYVPTDADPRIRKITIGHLLAMRSGLERTSGANYGRWVSSANWVRFALSRPFVDEPGGRMLYSTGNSHLLSAILSETAERSTLELARAWLGEPLGITIPPWDRDPQGIYFGGNNMALSPRALLRFGETFRNGGEFEGKRVLSAEWVQLSWTPQEQSPHTGHHYGFGWFITEMGGHAVYYAWGYGGQMLYVVPSLALTIVMTSDPDTPSGRTGYVRELHALVADGIIPAAGVQAGGPSDSRTE
jgi:CubicO group peptidase (beta-lactamase class C family)